MTHPIPLGLAGSFLLLAVTTAMNLVLPTPSPVVVHALRYSDGVITQERTVYTKEEVFFMSWSSEIVDVEAGLPLPDCQGTGARNYRRGHIFARLTLADWVGNTDCSPDDFEAGKWYYPRIVFAWGDDQLAFSGERFQG